MRAGNQQILLILAVFFGVLCALSPPTFGDSFSDFETFDAQKFLSDAKAKQVAEAAKRGALVGFIISAVLCFVLFPIDDKRLLKVLIIIAATAGGYFGAKNSAENRGASADPALKLQSEMSRGSARRAGLDADKEFKRMDRMGIDQVGLTNVLKNVDKIRQEKSTAATTEDVAMFENQLQRLIPALQKQLDAVVASVDSLEEFETAFGGAGIDIAAQIANLTGIGAEQIFKEIEKKIKVQELGKQIGNDKRESMERQAEVNGQLDDETAARNKALSARDARTRLNIGRSYTDTSGATQMFGPLSEAQMKRFSDPNERAKLEELRANRERRGQIQTAPRTWSGPAQTDVDAIKNVQDQTQDAMDEGRADDAKAWRQEASRLLRKELEKALGAENVTDSDVATAVEKLYKGENFEDFVNERRRGLNEESLRLQEEALPLSTSLQTGAGALSGNQLLTLLENPELFEALTKDIDRFMKGSPAAEPEPREEAKPVAPESVQKPTIAEEVQTRGPQKRSRRRQRRMEAR